jgi:glycosyltransferase involved in cell wall biosynthesis
MNLIAGHDPRAVEIVVPVFDEASRLEASIRRLHRYLVDVFLFSFRLTIADNASTDQTWLIARELAEQLSGVVAVRLEEKGRRALHAVWSQIR